MKTLCVIGVVCGFVAACCWADRHFGSDAEMLEGYSEAEEELLQRIDADNNVKAAKERDSEEDALRSASYNN